MSTIELSITSADGVRRVLISNILLTFDEGVPVDAPRISQVTGNYANLEGLSRSEGWRASQTCFAGVSMFLPIEPQDDEVVDLIMALRKRHKAKENAETPGEFCGYMNGHVSGDVCLSTGRLAKPET